GKGRSACAREWAHLASGASCPAAGRARGDECPRKAPALLPVTSAHLRRTSRTLSICITSNAFQKSSSASLIASLLRSAKDGAQRNEDFEIAHEIVCWDWRPLERNPQRRWVRRNGIASPASRGCSHIGAPPRRSPL